MGMGGSGIAGDLTAAMCGPTCGVPVIVPKGYETPAFVGPQTLVFAVSFSGNTEETIEAATHAMKQGGQLVIMASGGQLVRARPGVGRPLDPHRRRHPDAPCRDRRGVDAAARHHGTHGPASRARPARSSPPSASCAAVPTSSRSTTPSR